jgi:GT2 family glycosyltransferase
MPSISLVIVTRDRRDEILALLADLAGCVGHRGAGDGPEAGRAGGADDITVVDNGSSDGTPAAIRERWPSVRVIENGANLGAPAARGAGVAATFGDILVFLDDDTRVEDPDLLERVRAAFAAHPQAGVIAFRLLDPATRLPRTFEIPSRDKARTAEPFETTWFVAAGCAVRRAVYDGVGGMDASLVYGFEELDLAYRVVGRGFRIYYRPEIVVLHSLSRTARPSWRRLFYFYRNKLRISPRYLPWRMVLAQTCAWSGYFLIEAARTLRPDVFVAAFCAGLAGLPDSLRRRRTDRLGPEALARLRALGGRLYH